MWFDVRKALTEIRSGDKPSSASDAGATRATRATRAAECLPHVAQVARVARPQSSKPENGKEAYGLHPDADELLTFLLRKGPHSYGAAATSLGWAATRAWQAHARLRAAGLVWYDEIGRAVLVAGDGTTHSANR